MAKAVKVLALSGMLGSGFLESSVKRTLSWDPDFIGFDAGSTDGGQQWPPADGDRNPGLNRMPPAIFAEIAPAAVSV
jgi:hypothetical protein